MSNALKKLKKEKKATTIDIARIVELTLKMIDLKVIQLALNECTLHMFPHLLQGKTESFKKEWYSNILSAWFTMSGKNYSDSQVLTIYNLDETKEKIGTFTVKGGFTPA